MKRSSLPLPLLLSLFALTLLGQAAPPPSAAAPAVKKPAASAAKPASARKPKPVAVTPALTSAEQKLLDFISARSIQSHVSFLASDALEGRDTPSKGLDIAAEYIAAQFRRYGLEPMGDEGYFQNAPFALVSQPLDTFTMTIDSEGKSLQVPKDKVAVQNGKEMQLSGVAIRKIDIADSAALQTLTEADVAGKAVYIQMPNFAQIPEADREKTFRTYTANRSALLKLKPALLLTSAMMGGGRPALRDVSELKSGAGITTISVVESEFRKIMDAAKPGETAAKVSVNLPAPKQEPVRLKNVAGVLRGSDPVLKDTYVLVTAHYDHVGVRPSGDGDRINNGANDDASGVASMLELAAAFSQSAQRPKRSILFMAYFGEEKGLLGSRYYGKNPLVPLAKTAANLNLEHMGRTDDNEGNRTGKLTASGFDYTTLGDQLIKAGKMTGIEAWNDPKNSQAFFGRSDNQSLADAGVPAITLAVAWIFPDYHRPGDHWDKIDYANMEKVNRTVALTLSWITNSAEPVRWVESNPATERYLKAYRELHGTN